MNSENTYYNTMLFLLIETLKNINNNITGDITIFFKQNGETVKIMIGIDYEFKKLQIKNQFFSIYICNCKGTYIEHTIYYKDIIGFCSDMIYIMHLDHGCDYLYPEQHQGLPIKLSELFNEEIKENLINQGDSVIKITFFEDIDLIHNIYNNNDKLLVLILEPGAWQCHMDNGELHIKFNTGEEDIHLGYHNIVTYFNYTSGLFLNRNVKIVNEDFKPDKHYVQEGNIVYVNFKECIKEDLSQEMNLLDLCYNLENLYNSNKNFTINNNLIIGDFSPEKEK